MSVFDQIYDLITKCLLLTLIMILTVWGGTETVAWKVSKIFEKREWRTNILQINCFDILLRKQSKKFR